MDAKNNCIKDRWLKLWKDANEVASSLFHVREREREIRSFREEDGLFCCVVLGRLLVGSFVVERVMLPRKEHNIFRLVPV